MKIKDILIMSFKNLTRRRTQNILTGLSVIIGVLSVLLVSTIGENGKNIISEELNKLGLSGISIYTNKKSDYVVPLYADDAEALKKRFKDIKDTLPIVMEFGSCALNRKECESVLLGVGEGADKVYTVELLYGRIPNKTDVRSSKKVAVIDDELANKAFKRSNVVGKLLTINFKTKREKFKIIGVIKSQKSSINKLFGNNLPDIIYLPYTSLNELREKNELSQITITCFNDEKKLENTFVKFLSNKNSSPNGYLTENISNKINQVNSITLIVSLIINLIAGVALCVAGLGIMNIMFASANERRKEIGICLSIGATEKDIMMIFLSEAILITALGGAVGASIGFIIIKLSASITKINLIFNLNNFIAAEILAIICGIVFSIAPAINASRLDPITALKNN